MGMAASQARFLQLTARKTNIEYMGQQINQERLALANESAGLFEKQLTMVPPTPPSSLDDTYYTPAYTFTDSDGVQKKLIVGDGTTGGVVTYDKYQPDGSYVSAVEVYTGDLTAGAEAGEASGSATTLTLNGITYTSNVDATGNTLGGADAASGAPQFDANTGRLIQFGYDNGDGNQVFTSDEITYSPEFDEAKFDDDMNEYEYAKATYDYEIEQINLETSKIQKQDKSLELKLKQLDTEHNAIQTEMDAVQKVLTKNIESSFKTFS